MTLNIGATAAERWCAGADSDAIVDAAITVAGVGSGTAEAARASTILRPTIEYYPFPIAVRTVVRLTALSLVFYGALVVIGAELSFGAVLAAGAYATLAASLVRMVLTVGLLSVRTPTIDDLLTGEFVTPNAAAFLSQEAPAWLLAAGRTLDSLTVVYLLVFAALLDEFGGRVSPRAIAAVVTAVFVLWLFARVAWAAVFSG